MKIKVSDYIAKFLSENGIKHVFTVTGGGAMHLNDSLGHYKDLQCIYNHHEQACAIAAESYARINGEVAAVCVTTGPGGTNAITGVMGGFVDSIPMLVISGQFRYDLTARYSDLGLRAMGDQEFDIVKAVSCMTKYAEMVIDPLSIRYHLEKALYLAKEGRPGPTWIDVPLNVQGSFVEESELLGFESEIELGNKKEDLRLKEVIAFLKKAERPVIYAGSSIQLGGIKKDFLRLVSQLNIPVVTAWNSIDTISDDHPLYAGRAGIMGDRAGNFAVQNSDLVLSLGCRLSIRQVGFNFETWAREAKVIVVDIDEKELKKHTVHIDLPVHGNIRSFIPKLYEEVKKEKFTFNKMQWISTCINWRKKYPVVQERFVKAEGLVNPYALIEKLSNKIEENAITVVGNGTACVVGSQGYTIKENSRFIINSGCASMGYDLPAAIGACIASGKKSIICITGDGSIQMNLQELQTIIHHRLPIKIFVLNNNGYHSIRQTQLGNFGEPLVGIGPESKDLSFPDLEKIAYAYGYDFIRCEDNQKIDRKLEESLMLEGPAICEIIVDSTQNFEPKSASKKLEDGRIISPPLENLAPFLEKEELEANMIIPVINDNF